MIVLNVCPNSEPRCLPLWSGKQYSQSLKIFCVSQTFPKEVCSAEHRLDIDKVGSSFQFWHRRRSRANPRPQVVKLPFLSEDGGSKWVLCILQCCWSLGCHRVLRWQNKLNMGNKILWLVSSIPVTWGQQKIVSVRNHRCAHLRETKYKVSRKTSLEGKGISLGDCVECSSNSGHV